MSLTLTKTAMLMLPDGCGIFTVMLCVPENWAAPPPATALAVCAGAGVLAMPSWPFPEVSG
jgi:hypothetical protein